MILNVLAFGTSTTSNVLVVKSEATNPVLVLPGNVTELNKNKSPTNNPCAAALTVTDVELVVEVKVHPVKARVASNGVMS